MRLVFAGTPAVAVPTFHTLHAAHDIAAVVTRPDAPQGRGRVLTPSAVAVAATDAGVPLIKTAKLDADATATISALAPELGVIVAYGGLVREPLLSTPTLGWINLHFSTLPSWRGAAPVQHALIAGDGVLGMSVFQLVAELDAGAVFASREVEVAPDATAGEALSILAEAGALLTAEVVEQIAAGFAVTTPQHGIPTFAPKLGGEDGRLNFAETGERVYARFRGVTPEPGAFTTMGGTPLKILVARLAPETASLAPGEIRGQHDGILIGTLTSPLHVARVQPAGKGAMSAADWWRGHRGVPRAGS